MTAKPRERLPLPPLLHAYSEAGLPDAAALSGLPGLGPRFRAVLSAGSSLLDESFLDGAAEDVFQAALVRFYEACVQPPLHADRLRRRRGMVRHALAHLLRCPDPLPQKLQRCLAADGPYFVAGLGPSFWSAVAQALRPASHPAWTAAVELGLRRLGLLQGQPQGADAFYAALIDAHTRLRSLAPALSALHCAHFLSLVALMEGRNLFAGTERLTCGAPGVDGAAALRAERSRHPLRERLKERGQALAEAQGLIEAGLGCCDGKRLGLALSMADPEGAARTPLDWGAEGETLTLWVGRLWEADDPYPLLEQFWAEDPLPAAGLWLPAAVLHLKDAQVYQPWNDAVRAGFALLDDSAEAGTVAERYRLLNEGACWLRQQHGLHPLEVAPVLASLSGTTAEDGPARGGPASRRFGGFCADTFRFLAELAENNHRDWMEQQRQRYHFAVRTPLVELCQALTERYVEPVLCRRHGWALDTDARTGLALTSVVKNDYGRSQPYNTTLWLTFCGRDAGGKRSATQFFVRLDPAGLSYGLRLGASPRAARQQQRGRLLARAEALYAILHERGAFAEGRLYSAARPEGQPATCADDFQRWLGGKELALVRTLLPDAPLLAGEELVGDVLLTFDRLLPLYACAVGTDSAAGPLLPSAESDSYGEAAFRRDTFLSDDWLRRALGLLEMKRQLILQGVPGTGKTHVARCLARLLADDVAEAQRLVQFHPAYSYEEFVEGIKVKSVEVNGRHDVTYPVEDGLLCGFAARAAAQPSQPHVLVIDEINRGNLPRIFGELLYLLEYRDQEVLLPYSRRGFRLPGNLYLVGTMNAADRSVALLDQALRRRFSFLEMPPDATVLASWLEAHPPAGGARFAARVVGLFERLNARLRADFGPQCQVGHSYFMVPELDEARLAVVWQHQVRPLLHEYTHTHPGRSATYELEELLGTEPVSSGRKRPSAVNPL
jgi:MoxR-like ATPase